MFPPSGPLVRTIDAQRGPAYSVAGISGIIAVALAQDSVIFATRCGLQAIAANADPNNWKQCVLQRLKFAVTTLTAFTTPVTAGRRLSLHRATNAGAEISGGTLLVPVKKDLRNPASIMAPTRIATTGGLTLGGLAVETDPLHVFDLAHIGASGARAEFVMEHAPGMANPLCLNQGNYFVLKNPVAMDAGGTFQLDIIECEWHEQRADESGL